MKKALGSPGLTTMASVGMVVVPKITTEVQIGRLESSLDSQSLSPSSSVASLLLSTDSNPSLLVQPTSICRSKTSSLPSRFPPSASRQPFLPPRTPLSLSSPTMATRSLVEQQLLWANSHTLSPFRTMAATSAVVHSSTQPPLSQLLTALSTKSLAALPFVRELL